MADQVHLTIAPGTGVKMWNTGLFVNGVLTADGSSGQITFTSLADDALAGDTNGDGANTVPGAGNWRGIYLSPASGASVLKTCVLRYGGAQLGYINSDYRSTLLYVDQCPATISNCTMAESALHGIEVFNGVPVISNCTFRNLGASGYALVCDTVAAFPLLSGNLMAGAGLPGIAVPGGTMTGTNRWTNPGTNFTYFLNGELALAGDARWVVDPGTRVAAAGQRVLVYGTLIATGTVAKPILFTSRNAAPQPGDWKGLYFAPGATNSVLDYVVVSYGGNQIGYFDSDYRYSAIFVDQCSPALGHLTILNSLWQGLELYGASPTVGDAVFDGCGGSALLASAGSRPTLGVVKFNNNGGRDAGSYTLNLDADSIPVMPAATFTSNRFSGIQIRGGAITRDAVWRNWATNAPFVFTGDVSVNPAVQLTVESGATVKGRNVGLYVNGTLHADGTPARINFSSWLDDAVGGDSNGDGASTVPAAGDWKGIYLASTAGASVLHNCLLRYAGQQMGYINSDYRKATVYIDGCAPTITNCTIADSAVHGVELFDSAAIVHNNLFNNFANGGYAIVVDRTTQFGDLAGNTVGGDGNPGIAIGGGTITTNRTWHYPGSNFPYFINGDVTVTDGVTLTLEPGVSLRFAQTRLWVTGTLLAQGNASMPIEFTSRQATQAPGDWFGIYLGPGAGNSQFRYTTIAFAGRDNLANLNNDYRRCALYLNGCSPLLDHVTVDGSLNNGVEMWSASPSITAAAILNNGVFGLRAESGSRPVVQNTRFVNNGANGNGAHAIGMDASCVPEPTAVTFASNRFSGIRIWGGTLGSNATWKNWATNAPYVVTADTTVASGVTLLIEAGTSLKFQSCGLYVNGTVAADGTSAPVTFTSWHDATAGGDSNGEGTNAVPAAGNWKGIYLSPDSGGSVFDHCHFRYAGQDNLLYVNSDYRKVTVYVNSCSPRFANCTFADSWIHGLELFSSQSIVQDCAFANFSNGGYPVVFDTLDCYPLLSGNTATGDGTLGIAIPGGTMTTMGLWSKPGDSFPYFLNGNLTVDTSAGLRLEPGITMESSNVGLYVNGTLSAVGAVDQPIVFTSRNATPQPGDWKGLYFGPQAGSSALGFCQIRFAGQDNLLYVNGDYRRTAVYVDGSNPQLGNLVVENNLSHGLELYNSTATLHSSLIRSNGWWGAGWPGVELNGGGSALLANNTITDNGGPGVYTPGSAPTLANNIIVFNKGNGIAAGNGTPSLRNNDVFGNQAPNYAGVSPAATDLSADPQFVDHANGDFHLAAASPLLGAGDPSVIQPEWMDLDGHLRVVGQRLDLGVFESGSPAAQHIVDGLIRNLGETLFVGEGKFTVGEQTKQQTVPAGQSAVYQFQAKYSGNQPDAIRLAGPPGGSGWTIRYFDAISGGTEITDQVISAGGFAFGTVQPGGVRGFRLEVTPGLSVPGNTVQTVAVTLISGVMPTHGDQLVAATTARPRHQPDLMVRREIDPRYAGKGVYNATGDSQTVADQGDASLPVRYYLQLVNSGNLTDQFLVRGPAGGGGWTVAYFDALNGGSNITAQVTGAGWITPGLTISAGVEFRVEVTGDATVQGVGVNQLLLTAVSQADPAQVDAVKILTAIAPISSTPQGRTYTSNGDFERGSFLGVEDATVPNQLQLAAESVTLPFIWVPNSNEGTVSKVDTRNGRELGRYRVSPPGLNTQCSRTTVDQQGNCWVANRQIGSVVKIGLFENGQYVDRNHDGIIQTSRDLNGDGDISPDEMLPWGQDECVLVETIVIPGKEGNYIPGSYTNTYADDYWNPGPRGVAVDATGNLWLGTYGSQKFYYLDGNTGNILRTIDFSTTNHNSYGALIDGQGIVWSAGSGNNNLLRLDPRDGSFSVLDVGHTVYGIGLDHSNHVFASGWQSGKLSRINVLTGQKEWTVNAINEGRGVAVTDDGDVWIGNSGPGLVSRWSAAGKLKATIPAGNTPTGVSVDSEGKVWVVNDGDEYIKRIDPLRNQVDLSKRIVGGVHYGYSDMTGIISRTTTTRVGVWSITHDSQFPGAQWGTVSWNANTPADTAIRVQARSSADRLTWSVWETVTNGVTLTSTRAGKYLEVMVTLQVFKGDVSPVLDDLTITPKGGGADHTLHLGVIGQSQIQLTWDASQPGTVLEQTDKIGGTWQPVPGVTGGSYTVTIQPSVPRAFYQLHYTQ